MFHGLRPEVFVMNSTEVSSADPTQHQIPSGQSPELDQPSPPQIGGFDRGTPHLLREPSLYLSIAVIFVATFVSFSKTPTVFWVSFVALSAIAVMFNAFAERM